MSALAYLGQPYWHEDKGVRKIRTDAAAKTVAYLMKAGYRVFSPITHSALVRDYVPADQQACHDFWLSYDKTLFDKCDFLLILPLEGWRESRGLAEEMGWAMASPKPILQLTGQIPGIPQACLAPSLDIPQVVCDQFGPRFFPRGA